MAVPTHNSPSSVDNRSSTSAPPHDIGAITVKMAVHIAEAATAARLPVDEARRLDIIEVTRCCLEVVFRVLNGAPYPRRIPQLEYAAQVWAREGVALETILHAMRAGTARSVELVAAARRRDGFAGCTRAGTRAVLAARIINSLNAITTIITAAYVNEIRGSSANPHRLAQNAATALLRGDLNSVAARHSGVPLADDYTVLAVHLPSPSHKSATRARSDVIAQQSLGHIRDELALRSGHQTLAVLSTRGGTILLPANQFDEPGLDQLVAALARTANIAIVAVAETSVREQVPAAGEHVHQMLDALIHLHYPGGLYWFGQFSLEVQLARPGHARDRLASILDPLDDNPELLSLLRFHYDNDLDRQRTAQQFHIHTNTVDNRLKSIARLTGWDPVSGQGAWILQSALIARGGPAARPNT